MSATGPLGVGPRDNSVSLDALPTEKQFQEVWNALSYVREFGTDVVFGEAMDAVVAACESASLSGDTNPPTVKFDLSSVTWESVGRLGLYVQDTRSDIRYMLDQLDKIAESIPILLEHLHTMGEHDMQPIYNHVGSRYDRDTELFHLAQLGSLAETA